MPSVLGEFEQLVLFALVRLGPDAYGATIRREIEGRAQRELSISAVYTTLQRLEQKGLVRSRVGDPLPERGGRRRKYFELLPSGARSLKAAYAGFPGLTGGGAAALPQGRSPAADRPRVGRRRHRRAARRNRSRTRKGRRAPMAVA